ncbi:g11615 [Coccomyxa viridis]|uniref:G11615 protein n=1 Tax=Coccomyxa viridis TaxID=1274662 RepID=A0ABP1GD18_9CHLO
MRPPASEHCSSAGFSGTLDAVPPIGAAYPRVANCIPAKRRAQRNGHLSIVTAAGGLLSLGESGRERDRNGRQPLSDGIRSNGSFAAKGKEALRAAAQRWGQPLDRDNSHSKSHKDEGLPTSLFAPFKGELPADGKTLTEREEFCDPMERSCQTPMHVWESKCTACYGSGTVSFSSRRGRHSSATCASCTGMGYVRRTSSRIIPDLNGNGKHLTIGRPIALDEEEYEEYMRSLKNGKQK